MTSDCISYTTPVPTRTTITKTMVGNLELLISVLLPALSIRVLASLLSHIIIIDRATFA